MNIKNFIELLFAKILILFGYKFDKRKIPDGLYCYSISAEKNKNKPKNDLTLYTDDCPYRKHIYKYWFGCNFLGIITDDICFEDACKICSENENIKEDEYATNA